MSEDLQKFGTLMDYPLVKETALEIFQSDDWQSRFIVVTAMCVLAVPQTDVADGMVLEGACVFYVSTQSEDMLGQPLVIYEPWSFKVDLGASAAYTFEKVGDYMQHHNACDSEDFAPDLLARLEGSLWAPLRQPMSAWR